MTNPDQPPPAMTGTERLTSFHAAVIAVTLGAPIPADLWLPCYIDKPEDWTWIPLAQYLDEPQWLCNWQLVSLDMAPFFEQLLLLDAHRIP